MKPPALALCSLLLLPGSTAWAQDDPAVSVDAEHAVRGEIMVRATASHVRALIADPIRVAEIEGGTAKLTLVGEERCKMLQGHIQHPVASVDYTVETCPTVKGWRSELVQSDDFEEFHYEWEVEEVEGGTLLKYVVRTIPRFAVPQFIVDRQTKGSVKNLLKRVKAHLEAN